MKNKKKLFVVIGIVILLIILLFPIKIKYKDGGSIEYKSLTYSIYNWHSIETNNQYKCGKTISILGFDVYDNTYMN